MAQATVKVTFDQKAGEVTFSLDLQGNSELEHELLVAAIGNGRRVTIMPNHVGDELFADFIIEDESIWPAAMHALENRIRVRDGRPTIEEEQDQAEQKQAAEADAVKRAEAAKEKADAAVEEKKNAEDTRLADAVAAGISKGLKMAGKAAPKEAAAPAPEAEQPKS